LYISKFDRKDIFLFLIFLSLFCSLFGSFFFKANTIYERDTTLLEIPIRMHTAELLKQGNFALWTNGHGNGQPFLANPKMAVFYPTTLLYLFLPFFLAFKIHYFIHPLIGWLGLYLLGRSYGLTKKASFLCSCIFFFSGIYLSSLEFYNHIAALAWMMWVLFLHHLNPPIKSFKFLLNILVWVMLILSGAPEFIIITGLLALGQSFFEPHYFKKRFFKLILAFSLACLLSAIQLLPSFELLSQTNRASESEIWPLELIQLLNLVFPGILGDDRQPGHNDFWGGHLFNRWYPLYYSIYMGFGAVLLVIFCLIQPKRKQEKVLALEAFIFFLISCGKYSPFFFIYNHLPVFSSVRYPVKFFVGTLFCLSLLAGLGLDKLALNLFHKHFGRLSLVLAIAFIALFFVFKIPFLSYLYRLFVIDKISLKQQLAASILTGLIILLITSAFFLAISELKKAKNIFISAFIIFCVSDPVFHNRHINPTVPQSFFQKPSILKEINLPATVYRDEALPFTLGLGGIEKTKVMSYYWHSAFPFSGLGFGVNYILNHDFMSTYSSQQKELTRMVQGLPQEIKLKVLKCLGCQYYLVNKAFFNPGSAKKITAGGFPLYIEEISPDPVKPYVVFDFVQAISYKEKLALFAGSNFNPKERAIIDNKIRLPQRVNLNPPNLASSEIKPSAPPSIEIIEDKPGYGEYTVRLATPGLAIFPGNYEKGWKAWIDGIESSVFSVNLFFKGIYIPPGQHKIILRYLPDSFICGTIISLFVLLSLLIIQCLLQISQKTRIKSFKVETTLYPKKIRLILKKCGKN